MLFDDFEDDETEEKQSPAVERREGLVSPRESSLCLGHEKIEHDLLALIEQNRLPHALIFAGPEGIGKSTFAFRLARFLLARGPIGGADAGPGLFGDALPVAKATDMAVAADHPDFRKVASGAHPDMLVVERQFDEKKQKFKGVVDVEQVRRIAPFMTRTAAQGGWRIVIVDDADTMNRNAANALLKILEEPPANALLILIAHRPGALLPTIRSRSRFIAFDPPPLDIFTRLLRADHPDLTTADIATLHAIAEGSPGQGIRLLAEGGLESVHKVMTLLHSWPQWDWPQIHTQAEAMARAGQDENLQSFRDVMLWIVQSLLRAKARGAALTCPLDNEALKRMLAHYSLPQWMAIADALQAHFDTAQFANLDRRHAVMGAFSVFSTAA